MQPCAARHAALDVAVGRLDVDVGGFGGLDQEVPRAGQDADPEGPIWPGDSRWLAAAVISDRFLLEDRIAGPPRPVLEDGPGHRAAGWRLHHPTLDQQPARQDHVDLLAHALRRRRDDAAERIGRTLGRIHQDFMTFAPRHVDAEPAVRIGPATDSDALRVLLRFGMADHEELRTRRDGTRVAQPHAALEPVGGRQRERGRSRPVRGRLARA